MLCATAGKGILYTTAHEEHFVTIIYTTTAHTTGSSSGGTREPQNNERVFRAASGPVYHGHKAGGDIWRAVYSSVAGWCQHPVPGNDGLTGEIEGEGGGRGLA